MVMLSVRQLTRVSSELSVGEPSHLPTSSVFTRGHPRSGCFSVTDASALPAQRGSSVHAKPLKLSILMAAYDEEKTLTRVIAEILEAVYPCEIELLGQSRFALHVNRQDVDVSARSEER